MKYRFNDNEAEAMSVAIACMYASIPMLEERMRQTMSVADEETLRSIWQSVKELEKMLGVSGTEEIQQVLGIVDVTEIS